MSVLDWSVIAGGVVLMLGGTLSDEDGGVVGDEGVAERGGLVLGASAASG